MRSHRKNAYISAPFFLPNCNLEKENPKEHI